MDRYISPPVQHVIETTSIITIITTIIGAIPWFVALLPGVYYGLLIYEKWTGRKIADRRRNPR